MAATNQPTANVHPYFLLVITNYPTMVQRNHIYQRPNQYWQRPHEGGILVPGLRVHFGAIHTQAHEQLLYNTLRHQLEQMVRAYLRQTYQSYPIYLVFDMSHMAFSSL